MAIQEIETADSVTSPLGERTSLELGRIVAVAFGALLGLGFVGVLGHVTAQELVSVRAACSTPTDLVRHPRDPAFLGAPLGPLLLRNFPPGETRAVITEYVEGFPTKVVVVATRSFDRPLTLTGQRCSDGHPLRFASNYPFTTVSRPASPAAFDHAGEAVGRVEPLPVLPTEGIFGPLAPPYFLFSSPGLWLIELHDGNSVIGRVAVEVRSTQ